MTAFLRKGRLRRVLVNMPVHVILSPAALMGAARFALQLAATVGPATTAPSGDVGSSGAKPSSSIRISSFRNSPLMTLPTVLSARPRYSGSIRSAATR
jgi:hypothetical protein